jgi:hypothetical protein
MRLSTYSKPRVISCSERFPEHIGHPRGCLEEVVSSFKEHGVRIEIQDERATGQNINVSFCAELRADQQDAVRQLLVYDQGILCASTSFGKTLIGACLVARRGVSALILVHRCQLMDQWRERLAAFLALPIGNIGQIGGRKEQENGHDRCRCNPKLTAPGHSSRFCCRVWSRHYRRVSPSLGFHFRACASPSQS